MARTEPAAAHGWFPDPEGSGQLRMWDGTAWTRLTKYPSADDVIGTTPPPASAPVPPATRPRPRPTPGPPVPGPPASGSTAPGPPATTPQRRPIVEESAPEVDDRSELRRFVHANIYTFATAGVAIVYMVVAAATGLVAIGLLPVGLGVRAYQLREPAAPVALLAAAAVVVVSLVLLG